VRAFALYGAKRLGQFVLVVFVGINIAYLITHATPIDPVEQSIAAVTAYGNTSPDARSSAGLKGIQCDFHQLHRKVAHCYRCDWLPVGCRFGRFLYQLRTGVSRPRCRQYD